MSRNQVCGYKCVPTCIVHAAALIFMPVEDVHTQALGHQCQGISERLRNAVTAFGKQRVKFVFQVQHVGVEGRLWHYVLELVWAAVKRSRAMLSGHVPGAGWWGHLPCACGGAWQAQLRWCALLGVPFPQTQVCGRQVAAVGGLGPDGARPGGG